MGNVIIDALLFPLMTKDGYILTPIWINDHLIDLTIKPGSVGQPATLYRRSHTEVYEVQADVRLWPPANLRCELATPGQIVAHRQRGPVASASARYSEQTS